MRLIDEVVGYANANAAAARDANDQQTWAAHHRNCVRIRDEHAAEIERLQKAKCGALLVADERSKENVGLRAEIERLRAALQRIKDSDGRFDTMYEIAQRALGDEQTADGRKA